ncbi:MAG: FIST C-terminal domain-containing protein, partial [Treponema sp.]|nr:FIST C-terminal domain-containing protein [Treponema sp.]
SGGKPVFGFVALDVTVETRNPLTIHNGTEYNDRMVLLLLSSAGALLEPKFAIDSIIKQAFHSQPALVTAADNTRIISINDMPAAAYLEQIGLIQNGVSELLFAFPITVDGHDGSKPKICTSYAIDSDGSLILGRSITEGSTLNIGTSTAENVLITASRIISKTKTERNRNGLFIVACYSRNIVLLNPNDEMELVKKQMEDSALPYIFLYAAGEICPEYDSTGGLYNQYHQYSIISCIF